MFGEVGSIIVVAVLMLCCGLLITRLSLGNGLRKAADKTQEGLDKAKEVAVEKVAVAKEVIEDWNEQRKEAAQRKAYDREKDTRYTDAAQNAVETLENRGVVAANDDYEVEPIDTHTPSSWKELAEIACFNLYQHLDFAPMLAYKWMASNNEQEQLCGYLILTRLFMKGQEPNERGINEFLDQAYSAIQTDNMGLKRAIHNCLLRFTELDEEYLKMVQKAFKPLQIEF